MSQADLPLPSRLLSHLQYIWRLAIPFWMFRDANQGTAEQRIANYRYNRAQRKVLPFYMGKWIGIAVCMMQLTAILSDHMSTMTMASNGHLSATVACMATGIGFAFSCAVLSVLFFSYLYLTYIER